MMKSMRSLAEMLEILLNEYLKPELSRHGFRRLGRKFERTTNDAFWRFLLAVHRRGSDMATVALHVCVGFPALNSFLQRCPYLRLPPKPRLCDMTAPTKALLPGGQYEFTLITPQSNIEPFGHELCREVNDGGLPFLQRYGTLERAMKAWQAGISFNLGDRRVIWLASAHWLNGERKVATALLEDELRRRRAESEMQPRQSVQQIIHELESFISWLLKRKVEAGES